jgi:ribonuclease HI
MNNEWRINKPYIRMIKSDIELEIKNQKLEVKFIKVKGHSNEYFNDLADKLAKGELKRI